MANPRRRSRALRYCGAGGWPVGLPETISGRRPKLPRQPWQTRAVVCARSVILALGAGPSGFPKQFSGRRPKHLRQRPSRSLPSFYRSGVAGRASRNKFPSNAKQGDLGRRRGICGPKPMSQHGQPRLSRARTGQWPHYQPEADKWPDPLIRAADGRFHIVPYKEFISGQAEPFLSRAGRMATLSRPASCSGRFIKADGNFMLIAVLSIMAALSKLRTPVAAMAVL